MRKERRVTEERSDCPGAGENKSVKSVSSVVKKPSLGDVSSFAFGLRRFLHGMDEG
jgi:hypothetical protein